MDKAKLSELDEIQKDVKEVEEKMESLRKCDELIKRLEEIKK